MAKLIRRTDEQLPTRRGVDPFAVMREMLGWDPFGELGFPQVGGLSDTRAFTPHFEVKETGEGFVFKADLPGVREEDLDVSLTGNRLTISGKREEEKRQEGETFYAYERSYGSFSRAFTLPDGVDGEHCHADLKDGVLTLTLPKRAEAQPRRIEIRAGKSAEPQKAKA